MLGKNLLEVVYPFADKPAIVYRNQTFSYQQLWSAIVEFTKKLEELSLNQGDRVVLLLPNCPQFVMAFYSIVLRKGIVVPLNPLFKEEEIIKYLEDSQASTIITDSTRANFCQNIIAKYQDKIELIIVDNDWQYWSNEDELGSEKIPLYTGKVIYQYSGDSTGSIKRVCRTQYNLYHEARNFAQTTKINQKDNILAVVPFFDNYGLQNCLLAAIYNGATLIILDPIEQEINDRTVTWNFNQEKVLEIIEKEQITILPGLPELLISLTNIPDDTRANLSSVRLCLCPGKIFEKELFYSFLKKFNIPIRQVYCFTEAGSVAMNLDSDIELTYNSVGKPINNVQIKIIDQDGNFLGPNDIGEIMIRSATLTTGYDNQPELNQTLFQNGGFLTGDLGKKDLEGNIYITGKSKILTDLEDEKVAVL